MERSKLPLMLFTWAAAAFGIWAVSTVTLSEAVSVAASAAVFAVSVTASVVIFAVSCALEAVACPQAVAKMEQGHEAALHYPLRTFFHCTHSSTVFHFPPYPGYAGAALCPDSGGDD